MNFCWILSLVWLNNLIWHSTEAIIFKNILIDKAGPKRYENDIVLVLNSSQTAYISPSSVLKGTRFRRSLQILSSQPGTDVSPRTRRESKEFLNFIGSNLFDGDRKLCFSPEDVNTLAARRQFELALIPKDMIAKILNDKSVSQTMRYFCYGHLLIRRMKDCSTSRVLKKAFFDSFGGFMHFFLLPVVKMSFYVGKVRLKTVLKVLDYYDKCRFFLNTNGNGWRSPLRFSMEKVKAAAMPMKFEENSSADIEPKEDHCVALDLLIGKIGNDLADDNMIVALPKIELEDSDGYLGNVWLPYRRKTTFSLRSYESSFIIVDFYKKVSLCHWQKHIAQHTFDKRFKQWIDETLLAHIYDDVFYPSLGGLLSLYKHLERSDNCRSDPCKSDDNEAIIDKRDNSKVSGPLKQRRRTSKFMELESKSAQVTSNDDCEINWLRQLKIPTDSSKKASKKKKKKKRGRPKKGKGSKKTKPKSSWRKWLAWPWTFDFTLSGLSNWWRTLGKWVKYIITALLILIILCIICKLAALIMKGFCKFGGPFGPDCFGVMWNLIYEFLKKLYEVLSILCCCIFTILCKCCNNATDEPSSVPQEVLNRRRSDGQIEYKDKASKKKHRSEVTKPETTKNEKIKKEKPTSKKPIQHAEPLEAPPVEPKTSLPRTAKPLTEKDPHQESGHKKVAFTEENENRRSRRKPKNQDDKRLRGGQSYVPMEMPRSTDTRRYSEERTSWQTFYDF